MSSTKSKLAKSGSLTDALNLVLADTYTLLGLTQLAHWNVEGSGFFSLHIAFEQEYTELFAAVDEIAERVRALNAYALSGLAMLAQTSGIAEFSAPLAQKEYVSGLITAHEKVVADIITARDLAGATNDLETQDLMIKRLQVHDKTPLDVAKLFKGLIAAKNFK